ncbi:MAG: hydrogenase expression/formation protein [Promethearchaeota archaeon]|nr:MAG: hydrogenase expression/formation protein [Candidatus Lokiarchaeota archaeon]
MTYPPGKLPPHILRGLLSKFTPIHAESGVIFPPTLGQDTGIVQFGEHQFVVKTNPVTFATDEIGYYAVIINANDISTAGAIPKWFTITILLPEKETTDALCEQIFGSIAEECSKRKIAVVAGHTEVTVGLDRPIVAGTMLGILPNGKSPITTFGGKPGDTLLLIKDVAIEGTAIIARECEEVLLQKGISKEKIDEGKTYLHSPGISIVSEAELLTENFPVHALHGPTEGGFTMGLVELAENSKCGAIIDRSIIHIPELTHKFCNIYNINPLQLIASGCLIAAVDPHDASAIVKLFQENNTNIQIIGNLTQFQGKYEFREKNGPTTPIPYSHIDEITKIFKSQDRI